MDINFSWVLVLCLIISEDGFSQAQKRRLPSSVNHPALNNVAPYMSLDGDALVFLTDNSEDYALTPFVSYRSARSDWRQPEALPKTIHTRLNYVWGYTLSPDGKYLYYSTIKSPSVGGYDLWMCERKGSGWAQPVNFAAPVNSRMHEAAATVTPDQKTLYFMRCERMDQKSASGCVIMKAEKMPNGRWSEPVELPAAINTGNSQSPRILADTQTLIFSSDKFDGGKGGMDLYLSRLRGGEWTKPIPLEFANTPEDDQFVSVNAVGRYLLRDAKGDRKREMVEYLIPASLRPKGLMRVEGTIAGGGTSAFISVLDLKNGNRIYSGRPDNRGFFKLYLMEGSAYEVSIDPEQDNLWYFSRRFDLTGDTIEQVVRITPQIARVARGDEVVLEQARFQEYTAELVPEAANELKKVARLMKGNRDMTFTVEVALTGYAEDSVRSSPDMTGIYYDSVWTMVAGIDSLGQLVQRDTCIVKPVYHNDRTVDQARAIVSFLVAQGVPEGRLRDAVRREPALTGQEKSIVVSVRADP